MEKVEIGDLFLLEKDVKCLVTDINKDILTLKDEYGESHKIRNYQLIKNNNSLYHNECVNFLKNINYNPYDNDKYWGYIKSDQSIINILKRYINKDNRFLDLGCGLGNILMELKDECYVNGIEHNLDFKPILDKFGFKDVIYGDIIKNINVIKEYDVIYAYTPIRDMWDLIKLLPICKENTKVILRLTDSNIHYINNHIKKYFDIYHYNYAIIVLTRNNIEFDLESFLKVIKEIDRLEKRLLKLKKEIF